MATANNRTRKAGPVKISHDPAITGQDTPPIVASVPSILSAMADPLAASGAMGPATLREKVRGAGQASKGPRGPQWQWPESLRDSARSLEPKLSLNYGRGNGHLPYGKPNKPDQIRLAEGIVVPIPEESNRAILSSQIVVDFINGFYNGVKLSLCMADGDSVPLIWFVEIMGFNLDTYRTVESWQSLSKLLTRFAQASGRYCLVDRNGNLSLSVTPPESDAG
jgi:hypothetical protein